MGFWGFGDKNKNVTDSRLVEKIVSEGEAKLIEYQHPDPYTRTRHHCPCPLHSHQGTGAASAGSGGAADMGNASAHATLVQRRRALQTLYEQFPVFSSSKVRATVSRDVSSGPRSHPISSISDA